MALPERVQKVIERLLGSVGKSEPALRHTVFERMPEHVGHRLSLAQAKELRELHERMKHGSRP